MNNKSYSEQIEDDVRDYFKERQWTPVPLDKGNSPGKKCDWRFCRGTTCFLCEVKTIDSVVATSAYSITDEELLERRERERDELENRQTDHPHRPLILRADEWERLHMPDDEYLKQYKPTRSTEGSFRLCFSDPLKDFLAKDSDLSGLPYDLKIVTHDLYAPNKDQREKFLESLKAQILGIHQTIQKYGISALARWAHQEGWLRIQAHDGSSTEWNLDNLPIRGPLLFTTFYNAPGGVDSQPAEGGLWITLEGPRSGGGLRLFVDCHGEPNLETITTAVEEGRSQLAASASREENTQIARMIVLAFNPGFDPFGIDKLHDHVQVLLEEYSDLSAIAILRWDLFGPSPKVPRLDMFHNRSLQDDVESLPREAFPNGVSVQ